ncbi:MAG: hypothetical protein DMG59_07935 [Acidobacteria bacterium]|nr:MAG: hypothetical protein DMG59_07935 [Acidobacteriota bacterium]
MGQSPGAGSGIAVIRRCKNSGIVRDSRVAPRKQWSRLRSRFSTVERVVALGLALAWIGASVTAILLGFRRGHWAVLIVAPLGLWYGMLWVRAAWIGRRLHWKEGIWRWRGR